MKKLSNMGGLFSVQNISEINTDTSTWEDTKILSTLLQRSKAHSTRSELAEKLLVEFGSLKRVLFASSDELKRFGLLSVKEIYCIQHAGQFIGAVLRSDLTEQPLLNDLDKVMTYCHTHLGDKSREQFDCLFMDKSLRFKAHTCLQVGTTDHVAVYPRELIAEALKHNASALILVHNHPSANAKPSKGDISMTQSIIQIGKMLGISVADHIIVSRKEVFSFKKAALI